MNIDSGLNHGMHAPTRYSKANVQLSEAGPESQHEWRTGSCDALSVKSPRAVRAGRTHSGKRRPRTERTNTVKSSLRDVKSATIRRRELEHPRLKDGCSMMDMGAED